MEMPTFKFALVEGLGKEFLPVQAHDTDTGWDVCSRVSLCLRSGQYAKIPLGFRMFAPPGWWLELRPRSSSFAKKQMHCLYGVLDETWEGETLLAVQYIPDINAMGKDLRIEPGEAIAQLVPVKRQKMKVELISNEEYETLCKERNAERGKGGFGSTRL